MCWYMIVNKVTFAFTLIGHPKQRLSEYVEFKHRLDWSFYWLQYEGKCKGVVLIVR
jgi:hypothetical protein